MINNIDNDEIKKDVSCENEENEALEVNLPTSVVDEQEPNIVISQEVSVVKSGTKVSRFLDKAMSHKAGIYSIIVLVALLRALTVHLFIIPVGFAPGGITGVAAMLDYGTGINWAIWLFAINVPLLVMSFFLINKAFAFRTGFLIIVTLGFSLLLEFLDHGWGSFFYGIGAIDFSVVMPSEDMAIFSPVAGGLLTAVFVAILLRIGSSGGGVDIMAVAVNKYRPQMGIAWLILLFDVFVIFASFFVYGSNPDSGRSGMDAVVLAFIMIATTAVCLNTLLRGFKSALKFEIITTDPERLSKALMGKLVRGVTKISAVGMYKHENKGLLICIVRKNEIQKVKDVLKEFPETFAYVSTTSEVFGQGFSARGG
ncbi:MAG: YitT family protein [Firmicutes bacterium]|nr:YitT family protein [Bacillota bacterium]